jgi:replicative DNA helicase
VEIRARARRLKAMHQIEFIVIDYLQIMNYPEYKDQGRQQEVAAISSGLKAMAKELNVPVLVLSQLSRAPEERGRGGIPKLSDLRDSGSIEQDADVVMLLRRPSRIKGDSLNADKTLAIIDIAKQRNGPTGELKMNFDDEITRFEDRKHGVDESYVAPSEGGIEE